MKKAKKVSIINNNLIILTFFNNMKYQITLISILLYVPLKAMNNNSDNIEIADALIEIDNFLNDTDNGKISVNNLREISKNACKLAQRLTLDQIKIESAYKKKVSEFEHHLTQEVSKNQQLQNNISEKNLQITILEDTVSKTNLRINELNSNLSKNNLLISELNQNLLESHNKNKLHRNFIFCLIPISISVICIANSNIRTKLKNISTRIAKKIIVKIKSLKKK